MLYAIDLPYVPSAARAVRYDDPALAIAWPLAISIVSERDAEAPLLAGIASGVASDGCVVREDPKTS